MEDNGVEARPSEDTADCKADRIRQKVLKEIIDSEVTYQNHLSLVVKVLTVIYH